MRLTPFSLPPAQQADQASQPASPSRSRVLWLSCVAHALHDGYTDMIYVMLPVWQTDFGLGYGALAILRGIYAGTMATLQMPAGRLANRLGSRATLALGNRPADYFLPLRRPQGAAPRHPADGDCSGAVGV